MNYKNLLLPLGFSLSFIPVWGLLFLNAGTANPFSVFVGMVYSFMAAYFFKTSLGSLEGVNGKLFFIFPAVYLASAFVMLNKNLQQIFDPILWAFLALTAGYLFLKTIAAKQILAIFFISYLYAYHVYPMFNIAFLK